jgi:predicted ester cyclase
MDTEAHKATYRRIIDAINAGDPGALAGLVAADIVDHNPIPDQAPGLEGLQQWMASVRVSFPDLHGSIEHILAEGDLVAARVTWRGTHAAPFAGLAPTGQAVTFEAYHIVRFAAGQAAEWWGTADIFRALAPSDARSDTSDAGG